MGRERVRREVREVEVNMDTGVPCVEEGRDKNEVRACEKARVSERPAGLSNAVSMKPFLDPAAEIKEAFPGLLYKVSEGEAGFRKLDLYPNATVDPETGDIRLGDELGDTDLDDALDAGVPVIADPKTWAESVMANAIREMWAARRACLKRISRGCGQVQEATALIWIAESQCTHVRKCLRGVRLRGRWAGAKHVLLTLQVRLQRELEKPIEERNQGWAVNGASLFADGLLAAHLTLYANTDTKARREAVKGFCG